MDETLKGQPAAEHELNEALKWINQHYQGDLRAFSLDAVHWQTTGEARRPPEVEEKPTVRAAGG